MSECDHCIYFERCAEDRFENLCKERLAEIKKEKSE